MTSEEILQHCNALKSNLAAQWFIETTITKPMAEADEILHDLTKTPEAREAALHEWNALKKVADFLPEREQFALSKIPKA